MKERKAVERVITRMCAHIEKNTGRTPEGKDLREIEKKVAQGAVEAERKRTKQT